MEPSSSALPTPSHSFPFGRRSPGMSLLTLLAASFRAIYLASKMTVVIHPDPALKLRESSVVFVYKMSAASSNCVGIGERWILLFRIHLFMFIGD